MLFYLKDPILADKVATSFTVLLPLGGVVGMYVSVTPAVINSTRTGIPVIGWILDSKGVGCAALILFSSGILYGVLGIFPSAPLQLISLCILVLLRPLMYTFSESFLIVTPFWLVGIDFLNLAGDYTGKAFGYENFGTVYGLLNCIAGLFGLVLRPIDVFTKNTLHGNYTVPNVLGVVLGAISAMIITWRIYHRCDRSGVS